MKKEVGLWVDHRKAVIVTIENKVALTREILSNMEKHVRFSNGTQGETPNDFHGSNAEDMRDRKFDDHLGRYYESIIALIQDADSIWIFGPGEAKTELGNLLELNHLDEKVAGIESEDKLTTSQITAKVQLHYLN